MQTIRNTQMHASTHNTIEQIICNANNLMCANYLSFVCSKQPVLYRAQVKFVELSGLCVQRKGRQQASEHVYLHIYRLSVRASIKMTSAGRTDQPEMKDHH